MNRNANDFFAKTPTPHYPRSRFDMGIKKRLQTQGHGRLYPFFARIVYPGDTWQMDMTTFVRMDTSFRVPLDDIWLDTYWFFIPFRALDEDFAKVFGEGEPADYDDVDYELPTFSINAEGTEEYADLYNADCLLPYLGYNQAVVNYNSDTHLFKFNDPDTINPYPLAAYYKVYNDWFRDENLDASYPFKDLYDAKWSDLSDSPMQSLEALRVNRYHDYFSSAQIAPQKGPAVTIPLGTSAPVGSIALSNVADPGSSIPVFAGLPFGSVYLKDDFVPYKAVLDDATLANSNGAIIADLSNAAGTINELRLSFAIQALYEKRGQFGTRYIETIRGQWGIEVPDSFFLRPEYLGGSRVSLNNVPVLSTENSSQLGQMAGNSATLSNGGSWSKTFIEYGIILGLSCTRVRHSYTQGVRKELFDLKNTLDFYNPVFANIGLQPIDGREIFNRGTSGYGVSVFGYEEAWNHLRTDYDSFAGLFGTFSNNIEIQNKWHYGDYYDEAPYFSAEWLKEPQINVARTLTGQLISGASDATDFYHTHQFMFGYYYHPIVTRILPSHSVPVELIGRL